MLVILLAVFAGLIHNGDSDCGVQLQQDVQACQGKLTDGFNKAAGMSGNAAKTKKMCCTFKDFETCIADANKKCGGENAFSKQAFEMAKQMLPSSCSGYECNSGNSIVPVNAVVAYLMLYLSYILYSNIF